jgi:hypothetical protein
MTPPTLHELGIDMDGSSDGWRFYGDVEAGFAQIVYVVERPKDGYRRTIYMPQCAEDVSMDRFYDEIEPRLQHLSPPTEWEEQMEEAWGNRTAVCQLLQRINQRTDAALSGLEGRRHG